MGESTIGTVVISTEEYKNLIKESVMLQNVARYAKSERYFIREDVLKILGIEVKEGEE